MQKAGKRVNEHQDSGGVQRATDNKGGKEAGKHLGNGGARWEKDKAAGTAGKEERKEVRACTN